MRLIYTVSDICEGVGGMDGGEACATFSIKFCIPPLELRGCLMKTPQTSLGALKLKYFPNHH